MILEDLKEKVAELRSHPVHLVIGGILETPPRKAVEVRPDPDGQGARQLPAPPVPDEDAFLCWKTEPWRLLMVTGRETLGTEAFFRRRAS